MENKQILKKIALVMKDVSYIQKDATNTFQRYSYASEKVIKEAFGKAFREHRIVFQLSQGTPHIIEGANTDKSGKTTTTSVVIVPHTYTFYDVDSGESITGTFNGSGQTRDDKGVYAATTGAIKYILTSMFLIVTGDDPESRPEYADKPEKSAKPKVDMRVAMIARIITLEGSQDKSNPHRAIRSKFSTVDNLDAWTDKELEAYGKALVKEKQ